jgi:hypothetical protein
MFKLNRLQIVLCAFFASLGIGLSVWLLRDSILYEPTVIEISNAPWEKIFFKQSDKITDLAGLEGLRTINHRAKDIEIRIWRDNEVIILKKLGDDWSGLHLEFDDSIEPAKIQITSLNTPKSGWEVAWNHLNDLGILTIPGYGAECSGIDGESYVIEVNHAQKYRLYMYNVSYSHCENAKSVKQIGEIIAEEFDNGEGTCKSTEWIPCARFLREKQEKIK